MSVGTHDQQIGLKFFYHFRDRAFRISEADFYFHIISFFL